MDNPKTIFLYTKAIPIIGFLDIASKGSLLFVIIEERRRNHGKYMVEWQKAFAGQEAMSACIVLFFLYLSRSW